jgi:CHAT domain-containing protein
MKSRSQYSCLVRFVFVFILSFFSTFCFGQSIFNDLLIKAIEEKNFDDAKYWVEKGADINLRISDGKGLLHFAVIIEDEEIAEWLIENGADIDLKDNNGHSPLLNAFDLGKTNLQSLLRGKGALFTQKDSSFLHIENQKKLANIFEENYEYIKAENLYLEIIQFIENSNEIDKMQYATVLNNFAGLYISFGKYSEVESLFIKAMELIKEELGYFLGTFHPLHNRFLSNLGVFYHKIGLYDKAFFTLGEAWHYARGENKDQREYLSIQNSLIIVCMDRNFFDPVDSLINSSIQISKDLKLEINNPLYIETINLKAGFYYRNKKLYNEALLLYLQVLDAKCEIFDENSLELSSLYNDLGCLYSDMGDIEKGDQYLLKSLTIRSELNGEYHPDNILINFNLGSHKFDFKQYDLAEYYFEKTFEIIESYVNSSFLFLNTFERNEIWETYYRYYVFFYVYAYNLSNTNQQIFGKLYNNEIYSKFLKLNTSSQLNNILLNSNDSLLLLYWNNQKVINNQLQRLDLDYNSNEYLKLLSEYNLNDKKITQRSQVYRKYKEEMTIKWKDIQNKLELNEAAIEFISFSYYNEEWSESFLYCALIIKKDLDCPLMIPLFEQKQLDSLLVGGSVQPDYLYAARGAVLVNNQQFQGNGEKLYNLVWKPLEKELEGIKTVYYSPSGTLHQIAFAALPIDNATMLCEKFNLVQLSSTRQLATEGWHSTPAAITGAALFGGIKYDLEERDFLEMQKAQTPNEYTVSRSFISDSTFRSQSFSFLHGSLAETAGIAETFENAGINATVWEGSHATEETFKSLSNQNFNVLHIATHGYFYPNLEEKPETRERFILTGEQRFRHAPNPLLRSGLIMAGGSHAWKGKEPIPGMEDGILTAAEIADMNLTNVDLVVLSACETGLGDINGSEGVFGLQRAFKLAGAKTIIMSLWKVPDAETSEMMQSFYRKWLGGMDKREAFRVTQREMLGKYPNQPHKWAGFVMVD